MLKKPKVQSAVVGLLAALCLVGIGVEASGRGSTPATTPKPAVKLTGAALVSYTSCSQMLQQVKAQALKEVGPYGLSASSGAPYGVPYGEIYNGVGFGPGPVVARGAVPLMAGVAAAPAPAAASASSDTSGQDQDYSTTNDQEAGVDEPDMVKTNGQLMVVLRQQPQGVQVVDVSGSTPVLDGFLPLPQLSDIDGLFLVGQDAVVIGGEVSPSQPVFYGGGQVPPPVAPLPRVNPGGPMVPAPTIARPSVLPWGGSVSSTDVVVVSLADPAAPSIVSTFIFQGEEQGARLINGQVVLALTNQPRLAWVYPVSGSAVAQKAATAANKALIESSKSSDWLPTATVKTGHGKSAVTDTRPASCANTYHTVMDSGLGTMSIVSLDPTSDAPGSEVTVLGNAEDVYASETQVYVATTNWLSQSGWTCPPSPVAACPREPAGVATPVYPVGVDVSTDIYGFDISDPSDPQYIGSGSVPGTLIGQYAISEYDGYLRVATTVGEPTPAPADGGAAPAELSDNMVSVLQPENGALVTVGTLDGLGSGEKIYSVRFEADLGYVVTFNQIDPLYVIDLSNPDQPVLAGQVSLSGYSSFLQPLSAGLLLGVGQAVDQTLAPQGLQVEVFNVSDPENPSLVSQQQLGNGASSAAEYDPHALLWWPQSNLLVLPVDNYSGSVPSSAADVWSVSSSGTLDQVGTLTQPGSSQSGYPEIERAVVVGNDIYTLSEQGVMVNDMSSLSQVAWLPYQNASP